MRDGWVETTLGEVSALQMGRTPSRRENSYWTDDLTYPFCTIADMDAKYVEPKREGVTKAAIIDGKAKMAMKGTLLMSFKLTIGRMGFAARDIFPNEAIVMIEADESKVLNEFLYLRLASMDLTEGSGRAVKGSTLNSASIASIAFLLPPLPEQKRIVDLISSVDSYIEALQQQLESAKRSRNAVLHELLTAGGADWVETSLGEIADWGSGGTPKADNKEYYGGAIPWCVIGDLTEGEVWETQKTISQMGLSNSSAKIIEPGSVLLAMYGASIGRTGISAIPMATNQAIAFAKCKEENILPKYLLVYLQTQKSKFIDMGQGAAQPNISQTIIKSWPITLPSISQQKKVIERIESFSKLIQSIDSLVNETKNLRSSLLSDLLSGTHEIPAGYDKVIGAA